MLLIEQKEAAKLIRQNKDPYEDCQGAIHYNTGCEHSAQIIEQMKVREIIFCKDCKHHFTHKCMDSIPREICDLNQTFYDAEVDFCSLGKRRGEADGRS